MTRGFSESSTKIVAYEIESSKCHPQVSKNKLIPRALRTGLRSKPMRQKMLVRRARERQPEN